MAILAVNAVSAADNTSDIVASDASVSEIGLSQGIDESLGAADTFVITNQTFGNYFTAEGELNDNVSAGSTLDFQGTFTGEAYKVNITKPVNIISSTEDALFNEIGKKDSTGGCFHISAGGSGTNVSDINFINSAFYVTGASDVSIEKIHMVANMSGVGQGTGFMCIQAGSRYVTVKDSHFENGGTGSSIFVIGYSDYCTFDNNEVFINGSSGNAVYITTFVPSKYEGSAPTGNAISNNHIYGQYSSMCMAVVVAGNENVISGNLIDYSGSGIAGQSFSTQYNNTYAYNVLTGGCSLTAGEDSVVIKNSVEGTLTAGSNSIVEDNEMESLLLSKPNVVVDKNIINDETTLNAAALNTTLNNNIMFAPVTVKSKNNTIQNNIISTDSEYAIDLTTSIGNEVSYNNLLSANFTGDAAVNASEGNSVHDNGAMDNIVTPDNFFYFFNENGYYRDLNFTELYFDGEFNNLVDTIIIDQPLSIIAMDATLNDMAFFILADNVTVDGFKMKFDAAPQITAGSAILLNNVTNTTIENMDINYVLNQSDYASVIFAANAKNLTIIDNNLFLDAKTTGKEINNIIYVTASSDVLLDGNGIYGHLPSCYVDWKEFPPASGIYVKSPVSEGVVIDECSNFTMSNNEIMIKYTDVVGDYDTLYAVDIIDSENIKFVENNIHATGHTYIYGLYVEANDLLIDNNGFEIESDENYANAIEIEASQNANVTNNEIYAGAPNLAYPVYSGMNGGDLQVNYINNTISAFADIVYGMELCGTTEYLSGNTITVKGNQTTAIAAKSKSFYATDNTINALGENLGNSTTTDSFEPMTAAIHLIGAGATVENNTINSNSRGIVAEGEFTFIEGNVINVTDNGLDDSYAVLAEGADVTLYNNTITYVGNTAGDTINNAVNLKDCIEPLVQDNIMDIFIPSCYVDWKEVPPSSGNWVKFPVSEGLVFTNCSNLGLTENEIDIEVNNVIGAFDTIYCIDIKDSEYVDVSKNFISGVGCSYIYGLYIEANGSSVDNNSFIIKSDNYANGIEVEASNDTGFYNNYIDIESPVVAYGIYSGMNGGDLMASYFENIIIATSDIVYGMELCGSDEYVRVNLITVFGNKTTGIAAKSGQVDIQNNVINALGENLGNSTTTDSFKPMTAGIHVIGSPEALIEENIINSNSRGIVVENTYVDIMRNEINVTDNGLDDSYGIFAEGADIAIVGNNITYVGNTDGKTINNALNLKDCIEPIVRDNSFNIAIPSCYVDWKEIPPSSGNWVKFPVSEGLVFNNCSDLDLSANAIGVEVNNVVGAFDTIYCIDIKDSENVNVSANFISGVGCSYIYGLYIEANDSSVDDNSFIIKSDNYANGIEIEASINTEINNNYIEVESPSVTYGIYSGMNGGDLEVEYFNNTILATSDIVYGMELCGTAENVQENVITVMGNKTTGIAAKSEDLNIFVNEINALGENLGNSTTTDSFTPMTVGIHLLDTKARIGRNTIVSNSRGIVAENGRVSINGNEITVEDNGLDDSYGILAEGTDIAIFDNNLTYVGNTTGKTINNAVNLKDCIEPLVMDNEFNITLPSCYVDWKQNPDGSWVSSPISEGIVIDSADLYLLDNNIVLNYDGVVGDYDTIYAVDIKSDNSSIESNKINANGHSYIYGLLISGENFTVENNTMNVMSDDFYANGIDIEGPASGVVKDNKIATNAKGVVYPIYSAMSNGNITADYVNNNIIAYAQTAYAMELAGLKENVEGNTILIGGNTAIGIYSFSKDINVNNNAMYLLSNDTSSTAFLGELGNATITDNNISVMGEYTIDVSACEALVKDNYLKANELTGDASVNYDPDTSSVYNNTPKMDKYFLTTEGLQKYYGNTTPLEFILTDASGKPVSNKTVIITINGQNYTRITDVNGTARININLNAGNYEVNATYLGEGYNLTETAEIEILSTIEGKDITKIYRNGTQYYATFTDSEGNLLKNTDVNFNINGVFYTRKTNENGTARLNINLNPGKYVITVYNTKTREQTANNITVLSSIVDNSDLTKYYRNASQYVVKILDDTGNPVGAGKNVTFNINGVFYTRQTNASGEVKLNINLQPGKYVITANYNGCMVSNSITVLPTLITKDLAMKYRDGSTFNATVLDGQGKPLAGQNVEFNINGVFYSRTSGNDGIAKLNINLMPGNYIITSSYNGYSVGNKVTISG